MNEDEGSLAGENVASGVDARLQIVLETMEACRRALHRRVKEINSLPVEKLSGLGLDKVLLELGRGARVVVEEEKRLEEARRVLGGGEGVDFDAMRASIRCRIARLRDAIAQGAVHRQDE